MKKYYCKDCPKEICHSTWKYGKGRCASCGAKNRILKKYYCLDCSKEVSGYRAKRCGSCAAKKRTEDPKNCVWFIDGRTNKKYYCIEPDCNNEISYQAWKYYTGKCSFCAKRGKNHPFYGKKGQNASNYIDGRTPLSVKIRNLPEAKAWRIKIFQRDNYTCQECNQQGGKLEAHHIKHFSVLLNEFLQEYNQFSPIEDKETLVRLAMKWQPFWDIENGITLCKKCHTHKSILKK